MDHVLHAQFTLDLKKILVSQTIAKETSIYTSGESVFHATKVGFMIELEENVLKELIFWQTLSQ